MMRELDARAIRKLSVEATMGHEVEKAGLAFEESERGLAKILVEVEKIDQLISMQKQAAENVRASFKSVIDLLSGNKTELAREQVELDEFTRRSAADIARLEESGKQIRVSVASLEATHARSALQYEEMKQQLKDIRESH